MTASSSPSNKRGFEIYSGDDGTKFCSYHTEFWLVSWTLDDPDPALSLSVYPRVEFGDSAPETIRVAGEELASIPDAIDHFMSLHLRYREIEAAPYFDIDSHTVIVDEIESLMANEWD